MKQLFLLATIMLFSTLYTNAQTQYYTGKSDGQDIAAQLNWKADETVVGSYYFLSNPSRVYKLSGTNFVQGEIEIVESMNGKRTASGKLVKSMRKTSIVWSGELMNVDGTMSSFFIVRSR
jgi:hypothetical protein